MPGIPTKLGTAFRVEVGTAAIPLTTGGNHHAHVIKALCPGQLIYLSGLPTVSAADGYPLADGETLTVEVRDVSRVYAIASAAAQAVAILPIDRV